MDAARYQRLKALVHGAADLPAGERRAWLHAHAPDDPALATEALELLTERPAATGGLLLGPTPPAAGPDAFGLPAGTRLGRYLRRIDVARGRRTLLQLLHQRCLSICTPPHVILAFLPLNLHADRVAIRRYVRKAQRNRFLMR